MTRSKNDKKPKKASNTAARKNGGRSQRQRHSKKRATVQRSQNIEAKQERSEKRATVQRSQSTEAKSNWQRCKSLAHKPDILSAAYVALAERGMVGEERNAKLTYLVMTSRLLKEPVSMVVKGGSSVGKSHVVESVAKLFPARAYFDITSMSDKALVYSNEPLSHRMILLYEAAGLSPGLEYFLRSLLSKGSIHHSTVVGGVEKTIKKKGPAGLITTTTNISLHPENETRLISTAGDDTATQTSAVIHAKLADNAKKPKKQLKQWRALQAWLAAKSNRVYIPFGDCIAELIPPLSVRLRRDAGVISGLIKAHAILHQKSRTSDPDRGIVATIADYAVVRKLIHDLISEGVEATVPKVVRETVAAVSAIAKKRSGASVSELARRLGIDKSSASRRAKVASAAGYLRNLTTKSGLPARLVAGAPLPIEVNVLPSAKAVERLFLKRSAAKKALRRSC